MLEKLMLIFLAFAMTNGIMLIRMVIFNYSEKRIKLTLIIMNLATLVIVIIKVILGL